MTAFGGHRSATTQPPRERHPPSPATARIWTAQAAGKGTQALQWTAPSGDWIVVVMNPDGSAGITVRADAGATIPALPWLAVEGLTGAVLLALAGFVLIVVPIRRAAA